MFVEVKGCTIYYIYIRRVKSYNTCVYILLTLASAETVRCVKVSLCARRIFGETRDGIIYKRFFLSIVCLLLYGILGHKVGCLSGKVSHSTKIVECCIKDIPI